MIDVVRSDVFDLWLRGLRDRQAKDRILARIVRLAGGNFGDIKPAGEGISEMRIDYGPGYRLYLMQRGSEIVILLCGGDKTTQRKDIALAKQIASQWKG